jgi:uncharacterized membrane protein HdeD (DUF308 family)
MIATNRQPMAEQMQWGLALTRREWPWFVGLGVSLVIVGLVALASQVEASLATTLVIGWLLLFAGGIEILGSLLSRRWSGFFMHLLSGVLSAVVGTLFARAPVDAEVALTLLIACLFMVGGIFKIIAAASYQFEGWGWPLTSGVIDLILGVMIWMEWRASGLWVIGMFVGISLAFRGLNWIGLGLALRATSTPAVAAMGISVDSVGFPAPVIPSTARTGR